MRFTIDFIELIMIRKSVGDWFLIEMLVLVLYQLKEQSFQLNQEVLKFKERHKITYHFINAEKKLHT